VPPAVVKVVSKTADFDGVSPGVVAGGSGECAGGADGAADPAEGIGYQVGDGARGQVHLFSRRQRRWLTDATRLVAAILFKASSHSDNPAYFRCEEQIELQAMVAGEVAVDAELPAVVAVAGAGQFHIAFAEAARANTELQAAMTRLAAESCTCSLYSRSRESAAASEIVVGWSDWALRGPRGSILTAAEARNLWSSQG
jgi:hypothetical protein